MLTSRTVLIAGLLAACGGDSKHPTPPVPDPGTPPPPPAGEPVALSWLEGSYGGDAGGAGTGTLHVHASEGALYAIWLGDEQARVWIFDEEAAEGQTPVLQAWSFTGLGATPKEQVLKVMSEGAKVAVFSGGGEPSTLLTVRRTATGGLVLSEAGTPSPFVTGELATVVAAPAAILEDTDRGFAEESVKVGADAWVAHMAVNGAIFRPAGAIIGQGAVKERITKTLGAIDLRWEPVASGLSVSGTFGFTVGKATWTSRTDASSGKGSYVTIWEQQPGGTWKWIFDTGR